MGADSAPTRGERFAPCSFATLSVILAKGLEHRYLSRKPTIKLKKEMRRESIIDDTAEQLLPANPCGTSLSSCATQGLDPMKCFV